MVPGLRGVGITDGTPGRAEGHHSHALHGSTSCLHRGPLQSVSAGHHTDRQPEEVSDHAPSPVQTYTHTHTGFKAVSLLDFAGCSSGDTTLSTL